jgi:hypothetical protein
MKVSQITIQWVYELLHSNDLVVLASELSIWEAEYTLNMYNIYTHQGEDEYIKLQ